MSGALGRSWAAPYGASPSGWLRLAPWSSHVCDLEAARLLHHRAQHVFELLQQRVVAEDVLLLSLHHAGALLAQVGHHALQVHGLDRRCKQR